MNNQVGTSFFVVFGMTLKMIGLGSVFCFGLFFGWIVSFFEE